MAAAHDNQLGQLPEELLLGILGHVSDWRDVISVARLDRRFRRLARDSNVWFQLCRREWRR